MPESEINPFPELPPSSPSNPSNQLNLTPLQRGSFSSVRPTFDGPGSPSQTTPVVSPGLSPPKRPRNNLSNIDTSSHDSLHTPPRNQSFGSGAWSTVATPGLADNDDEEQHFDLGPSAPPLTPPITRSMSADRKNVRFMGPDGAPLSPATTHISLDSYDAPPAPPSSTFGSSPVPAKPIPPPKETRSAGNSSSSLDATRPPSNGDGRSGSHGLAPPSNRGRTNGTNHANRPGGDAASRSNGVAIPHIPPSVAVPPPPPPSLVSYPSHPPPVAQPYGRGLTSPHPQSAPTAPTQKQIDQTQKHAKWAISALDFDDIETARSELRKALAAIGG